jgi:hypothetical protein
MYKIELNDIVLFPFSLLFFCFVSKVLLLKLKSYQKKIVEKVLSEISLNDEVFPFLIERVI